MYNIVPRRTTVTTKGVAIVLYISAIYMAVNMIGQGDIFAQDKSTSITCTGAGPCEKTECVNGDCDTITTNSSNISSTNGSDKKELNSEKSMADSLKDRLNMRGD
jgi:hypothetical protein